MDAVVDVDAEGRVLVMGVSKYYGGDMAWS
jgi:hypothetical protein